MDITTMKLALMNIIATADSRLSPRTTHVLGNWHLQAWQLKASDFPVATVRLQVRQVPAWSFKTPTISHGEYYNYEFSVHFFAKTMTDSRDIMDNVLDYLAQNNKNLGSHIIDVINLVSKESVPKRGPRAYWRMVLSGVLVVEEPLS